MIDTESKQMESPLIAALDRLRADLGAIREAVARREMDFRQREEAYLRAIAGPSEYVSNREAARMLGISEAALSRGGAGAGCLRKRAIRVSVSDRGPVRYKQAWVLRHIQIRDAEGRCDGTCCDESE